MVETIGKQLCKARLSKGLTVDEAAHATKMRPDKILALENDDFSRFGNNAYAKGFLQLYGRFLGVDVTDQFHEMETAPSLNVEDYQYLNSAPEPSSRTPVRTRREAGPPSVAPLFVLVAVFAAAFFVFWIYVSAERLGLNRSSAPDKTTAAAARAKAATFAQEQSGSTQRAPAIASAPGNSAPAASAPAAPRSEIIPPTTSVTPEGIEVRRAEAAPIKRPEAITPSGGVNEIVVEPIRKTWVTIRKGSPDSPPIFEDYLYPGPSLKLHGTKFYVEVRDQTAVQIRKNGNPIAYQAPGISIQ